MWADFEGNIPGRREQVMAKKAQIIGLVALLASVLTGFPFGQSSSMGASVQPVHYLGTFYHNVEGELGEMAFTARGRRLSGLAVVTADGIIYRLSGVIDRTGHLSAMGKHDRTTLKLTAQVTGGVIVGSWIAATRNGKQKSEETGTWIIAVVNNPSEHGQGNLLVDGVKTSCKFALFVRDDSTCNAYVVYRENGNIQDAVLVGTWSTAETGPQLSFLPDPVHGISGEGRIFRLGSKGDFYQGGLKVGAWSGRNL
jgi:hypothetical protein